MRLEQMEQTLKKLADRALALSYRDTGSLKALSLLYKRHRTYCIKVAYKALAPQGLQYLADDVVQVAFIQVIRKIEQFNPHYEFQAWLYRIVANTAVNFKVKEKSFIGRLLPVFDMDEYDFSVSSGIGSQLDKAVMDEKILVLNHCISELAPKQKQVIKLSLKDKSLAEIARDLNENENTVKANYRAGLQKLTRLMKLYYGLEEKELDLKKLTLH